MLLFLLVWRTVWFPNKLLSYLLQCSDGEKAERLQYLILFLNPIFKAFCTPQIYKLKTAGHPEDTSSKEQGEASLINMLYDLSLAKQYNNNPYFVFHSKSDVIGYWFLSNIVVLQKYLQQIQKRLTNKECNKRFMSSLKLTLFLCCL